jgi:hypothetical protein
VKPHPRPGAPVLDESLAPSQPTDPPFHGVTPGGAPWVLTSGKVRLTSDGKLDLAVRGLVIPTTGTAGPVTTIIASLYCGADTTATPADTTQQVPISSTGNARIHDRSFAAPSTCLARPSSCIRTETRTCTSRWTAGACPIHLERAGERPPSSASPLPLSRRPAAALEATSTASARRDDHWRSG